jgi:chromosome segregation ATPase
MKTQEGGRVAHVAAETDTTEQGVEYWRAKWAASNLELRAAREGQEIDQMNLRAAGAREHELREALGAEEARTQSLSEEVRSLTEEVRGSQEEVENFEAGFEVLLGENAELEETSANLKQQLADLQVQHSAAVEAAAAKAAEGTSAATRAVAAEESGKRREEEMTAQLQELAKTHQKLLDEHNETKEELVDVQEQMVELEGELAELTFKLERVAASQQDDEIRRLLGADEERGERLTTDQAVQTDIFRGEDERRESGEELLRETIAGLEAQFEVMTEELAAKDQVILEQSEKLLDEPKRLEVVPAVRSGSPFALAAILSTMIIFMMIMFSLVTFGQWMIAGSTAGGFGLGGKAVDTDTNRDLSRGVIDLARRVIGRNTLFG